MDKIDEALSRLGEIEGQLRHLSIPNALDPDWPEEELSLIADDIAKTRKALEEVRRG